MPDSIWNAPLESLCRDLAEPAPAPAAVTAAAVTARMGLALLIKTLQVILKRKSFTGDRTELAAWIESAQEHSTVLAQAADDDATAEPDRRREEIPMRAARAASAGMELCAKVRGIVTGAVAADLEAAAALLAAADRTIRLCVASNQARRP